MLQHARWQRHGGATPRPPRVVGLRHLLIADLRELERYRAPWEALAAETSHPLVQPTWLFAWWRHCRPAHARLAVALVFEDDRLVGVGPFYLVRDRLGLVRAELLAAETSIGTGPLARAGLEAGVAEEIARALASMTPHPDVLVLSGVPTAERWPDGLAEHWPSPTIRVTRKTVPAPQAELSASNYEQWLAGRSRNFRQQIRRRRRRLEQRGVRFSRATPEQAHAAVHAFTRLHLERWSSRGGSKAISASVNAMLEDAVPAMLRDGGCSLYMAEAGASVVAAVLFLNAGRSSSYWLGGFAEEYASDSPTLIQLAEAVADGFACGRQVVDFGAGNQPYKQRFASGSSTLEWTSIVTARAGRRPYARLHARGIGAAAAAAHRMSPEARERLQRIVDRGRRVENWAALRPRLMSSVRPAEFRRSAKRKG